VLGDGHHEKRGDAVSYLPDSFVEFSREDKLIRERTEPLELRKREPSLFTPMLVVCCGDL
jgi:hypothetical protein